MGQNPDFARAWLRQRRDGARAVAEIEHGELRAMTVEQALATSEALLSAIDLRRATADRVVTSGFVEQQRLFARSRK